MAGAPGFEPGIAGPKPAALPLGYAPLRAEYRRAPPAVRRARTRAGWIARCESPRDRVESAAPIGDHPEAMSRARLTIGAGTHSALHGPTRIGVDATGGWMNDLKVTLMLADFAQVAAGKLFINGGGWSIMGPQPTPFAIVLDVKVPWHGINVDHSAAARPARRRRPAGRGRDAGGPATAPASTGGSRRRPAPGVKPGTQIDLPLVVQPAAAADPAGRPLRVAAVDRRPDGRGLAARLLDAAGAGAPAG